MKTDYSLERISAFFRISKTEQDEFIKHYAREVAATEFAARQAAINDGKSISNLLTAFVLLSTFQIVKRIEAEESCRELRQTIKDLTAEEESQR